MKNIVRERLNSEIYRELSTILLTKANNPKLHGATILRTELNADGSVVHVFTQDKFVNILNNSSGFFRTELAKKISLRRVPKLVFFADKGDANADRIYELLNIIKGGKNVKQ
jgi:ribosome-binding factor A